MVHAPAASYSEGEKRNGDPLESIVPASAVLGVRYAPSPVWNVTAAVTHAVAKHADDAYTTAANGTVTTRPSSTRPMATVLDLYGSWNITRSGGSAPASTT